jgi:hypothetical protein
MATPRPRLDRYGKPLPSLVDATKRDMSETAANVAQRKRILRRIGAMLDEHYPHLLRGNVTAEITVLFKVLHGTIQQDMRVGILWQYREEEE